MCGCFWLFDKNEIVISATSGEVSIISFASVTRFPVEIVSASLSLIFFVTTRIIK